MEGYYALPCAGFSNRPAPGSGCARVHLIGRLGGHFATSFVRGISLARHDSRGIVAPIKMYGRMNSHSWVTPEATT